MNNYRNEKGKSSRLDGYDYLVSFAQYNIYGRNFFVFGGVYKVEIAKPEHYEIGGYNISLLDNKDPIGEFLNKYRKRLIVKLDENLGINFELTYEAIEKKNIEVFEVFPNIASGNSQGLWQRWECYADFKDLTGGNKEFEVLVEKNGKDYILKNFKYSILEIFDTKTGQEYILERENYWKNVFETKKFGMNKN